MSGELQVELREPVPGIWEVAVGDSVIFRGPRMLARAIAHANQAVIDERSLRERGDLKLSPS